MRSLHMLFSHTDGKMMNRRSLLKIWTKVWAKARLDIRRLNSAVSKRERMVYDTSGWTVVASRNRATLSFRSHSTPCFAGTIALRSATFTCLTSLQRRGKEGLRTRKIHGKKHSGQVNGSLE